MSALLSQLQEAFSDPEHQSQELEGGEPGYLLIHGFLGTPAEWLPLASELHRAGASVVAPLLPGFGAQLSHLFSVHWTHWLQTLELAFATLANRTQTRVVVGFSLGGALALLLARTARPSSLVLLAPFTHLPLPAWYRKLLPVWKLIYPGPRPFARLDLEDPQLRHTLRDWNSALDLEREEIRQALRGLRVPLSLLEQLDHLARRARDEAENIRCPVWIIHGRDNQTVPIQHTLRLLRHFTAPLTFIETTGDHQLIQQAHPAYPLVRAVLKVAGWRNTLMRWPCRIPLLLHVLAQLSVLWRLIDSHRIRVTAERFPLAQTAISLLVPVFNEQTRLALCLEGLIQHASLVREILVIDTGSTDNTRAITESYRLRDSRVRWVEAGPPPPHWNGKVWALWHGSRAIESEAEWLVSIDADVRPSSKLACKLVEAAYALGTRCVSAALRQRLSPDLLSWLLHPAFLTTLVYRFGLPQRILTRPQRVLFSGQAFALHRSLLAQLDNFRRLAQSNAEDIALGHLLLREGITIAFVELDDDSFVHMYRDGRAIWANWPRSLPATDGTSTLENIVMLTELVLTQGLWLPLLFFKRKDFLFRTVSSASLLLRLAILYGTARVYPKRRIAYWFSPLADPLVVLRVVTAALPLPRTWRGRPVPRGALR